MTRLTEEMIIQRAKTSNMNHVRKLNIWGCGITDISVVKDLKNLEVLGVSLNQICTLKALRNLPNLETLYLRKNQIKDVEEILHLQTLPKLKYVWLSENPFCERLGNNYRQEVLRLLPKLRCLDEKNVSQEELDAALGHMNDDAVEHTEVGYKCAVKKLQHIETQTFPPLSAQRTIPSQMSTQTPSLRSQSVSGIRHKSGMAPHEIQIDAFSTDAEWDGQQLCNISTSRSARDSCDTCTLRQECSQADLTEVLEKYGYHVRDNCIQIGSANSNNRGKCACHRRSISRRSNLLSATLCLVKDLDALGLEVVECAVRCRINEIEQDSPH